MQVFNHFALQSRLLRSIRVDEWACV